MFFGMKAFISDLFLKTIINHPEFMESALLLEIMKIFPEMVSSIYETSVVKKATNYDDAIRVGLLSINTTPKKILDICTGTGIASFIANQVFPEAEIVAIDQSKGMIKNARSKAEKMAVAKIEFKLENAMRLSESDNSFDLIITSNAPVYLSEVARLLSPGGIFLMAFFFGRHSFNNQIENISRALNKFGLRLLDSKNVGEGVYFICERAGNY